MKAKVAVFVDLYLRSSRWPDQAGGQPGRPLLDQLSVPLGAIEETVALLRRLPAVLKDSEAEATAAQLALRVGRLRDVLEAFGAG